MPWAVISSAKIKPALENYRLNYNGKIIAFEEGQKHKGLDKL